MGCEARGDTWLHNGLGFKGNIAFNLLTPGHGIGAWSNFIDGGTVRAYDGFGLTGNFLDVAPLNPESFGSLISSDLIRSAQITCDFDLDLKCGVYGIQFEATSGSGGSGGAGAAPVPEPGTIILLGSGLIGLVGYNYKRNKKKI